MKHRTLGHTGLIVSEVALGSMQFGGKMNMGNLGQEDTTRMVKLALDRGINFIDPPTSTALERARHYWAMP
jgi:aryl-alcohol dehydrogenase-like predicted oxidoreductase